jgi:hypothetical protein
LPTSAKFCLECGKPVDPSPGRSRSPHAYTPKHLADKILTSKSALEGERKQVTVLFADLKGSMELLADREALRRGLDHLQAAEFVYETALFPDLEYPFKHALTHEVTYGGLLRERRRELHARIVEAIETLHRARLAEHAERLAQHALRGELREKAVGYGVR